jgi:EmrB/QacA subfamily drug resistance transporter
LPDIVEQFDQQGRYAWVVLALAVPATVVLPISGKLSDAYGPRRFYVVGVSLFLAGSVAAAVSPTFLSLILARVVQGAGLGAMQAVAQTILGEIVAPRDRGKYIGILSGAYGVATVAGPLLGGALTDGLGWRWLFVVNVPVALATIAAALAWIHIPPRPRPGTIDGWGVSSLSLSLLAFVFALSAGGQLFAWDSIELFAAVALALVFAVVFIAIERRSQEPVLPLGLFTTSAFALPNVMMLGVAAAMYGAIYFVPLFAQTVLGATASESGSILVPMLLSMIVLSIIGGQIVSRTGSYRPILVAGMALISVGFLLCSRMDATTQQWELFRNMTVLGVGLGAAMPTITVAAQSAAPPGDIGIATATVLFSRSIGTVIGLAVMGAIFASTASLWATFAVGLPVLAVSFIAAVVAPHVPLRTFTVAVDPEVQT